MLESTSEKRAVSDLNQSVVCEKCQRTFGKRSSLYAHIRKFHSEEGFSLKGNQICGICNEGFRSLSQLHEHLQTQHDIKLNFVDKTFYTDNDFLQWKTKIEQENQSSFVYRNWSENKDTKVKNVYYKCHRSGFSNIKVNAKRQVKTAESIKIGSTCPAMIKVATQVIDDICEIKVRYQSVHVGHEMQVSTLRLSKAKRTGESIDVTEEINKRSFINSTLKSLQKNKKKCKVELHKTAKIKNVKCICSSQKILNEESSPVNEEVTYDVPSPVNEKVTYDVPSSIYEEVIYDVPSPVNEEEINAESSLVDEEINQESSSVGEEEIIAADEITKQGPVDCIPRSVKNKRKYIVEFHKNEKIEKVKSISNSKKVLNKESTPELSNLRHSNRLLKSLLYKKNKRIEQLNKQLNELKAKVKHCEERHHQFSLEKMICRVESSEKPIFILQQIKPKNSSNTRHISPSQPTY